MFGIPLARRDVLLVVLVVLSLGATAPYLGRLMNANERPRIVQAIVWVDAMALAVDGPAARGIDPGIDVARSPVDGRLYPNKPPGATMPAVFGYLATKAVAAVGGPPPTLRSVTITSRLLGGLLPTLVLLMGLARRLRARGEGEVGDAAVVLLALATPLTSYGRLLFGHSLSACLLTLGLLWAFDATDPKTPSLRGAALGGAVAAAAITVEYFAAFAGLPLAVLIVWRWRQGTPLSTVVAALAGALIPLLLLAGYHAIVFGDPLSTSYHHVVDKGFAKTHAQGFLGLGLPSAHSLYEHLLSPWGGLLVWAPLLAMGTVVVATRWRTLDIEARWATVTWGLMVLLVTGLQQTGGWRVGPRYAVLAMPFAVYGLVSLLRAATSHRVWIVLLLGLALASTILNGVAANLFPHLIPHGNPWADLLWPLLADGHTPYAIVPGRFASIVFIIVCPLLAVGGSLMRCIGREQSRLGSYTLGSLLAFALLVATLGMEQDPAAASDFTSVHAIWEPDGARPAPHVVLEDVP